jgi:hypothetical protein
MAVKNDCVLLNWTESTVAKYVLLNRTCLADFRIWIWQAVCNRLPALFLRGKEAFLTIIRYPVLFRQEVVKSFEEQQAAARKPQYPAMGFSRTSRPARILTSSPKRICIVGFIMTLWFLRVSLALKILLLGHRKQLACHDGSVDQSETMRFRTAMEMASCWLPLER